MKRFLLFMGEHYEAGGGMLDFKGDFKTLEAAKAAEKASTADWAHILDKVDGKIYTHQGDWIVSKAEAMP